LPIEEQIPDPSKEQKQLDNLIFDAIELTQQERDNVYREVCRLTWNRVSKAKSL